MLSDNLVLQLCELSRSMNWWTQIWHSFCYQLVVSWMWKP